VSAVRRRLRHVSNAVRRELAGALTRRLARRYFTAEELRDATVNGRRLEVADAAFRLEIGRRGPRFRCVEAPQDEWLATRLQEVVDEERLWEVIAFLKVRRLNSPAQVIDRARSGELYDESYFTRRGGGGPYIGYPASVVGEGRWWENVAQELADRGSGRVLDVGCATGLLVKALEDRGVEAAGVDVSQWAVDHAVSRSVVRGSALELPWDDASFDVAISQDVMEHMHPDDLPGVLGEQVRVVRPGGTILHLIPFYPFDPPIQVDAHLCQATEEWWTRLLQGIEGLEIVRRPDERAGRRLARYFELRRL
jgi:SAM-dependent methyltransferase